MDQSNIVTKEADNGGAVTVILRKHYRSMIYEHLHNQNTYQKLEETLKSLL